MQKDKILPIAIIISLALTLINIISKKSHSEVINPENIPDEWPQRTEIITIYYTHTFMDSINSLNPQQVAEVQNKIKEELSDVVIPYTKVFNDTSQAILNPNQSSAASSIKKIVKYGDNHKYNMPDTPKYRKLKHTRRHKMAYWVSPDMPKEILIRKLRDDEPIELSLYLLAYGRHKDIDGKKTKFG